MSDSTNATVYSNRWCEYIQEWHFLLLKSKDRTNTVPKSKTSPSRGYSAGRPPPGQTTAGQTTWQTTAGQTTAADANCQTSRGPRPRPDACSSAFYLLSGAAAGPGPNRTRDSPKRPGPGGAMRAARAARPEARTRASTGPDRPDEGAPGREIVCVRSFLHITFLLRSYV